MKHAILTPATRAVFAGQPFAVAEKPDARAVHQQVQRAWRATERDLNGDRFLSSAEGRKVRHRPSGGSRA